MAFKYQCKHWKNLLFQLVTQTLLVQAVKCSRRCIQAEMATRTLRGTMAVAIGKQAIHKHTGKRRTWRKKKFRNMLWNINKCKWWMLTKKIICKWLIIQNWLRTSCRSIDEVSRKAIIMSKTSPWWKRIWRLMRHLRKRSRWFRSRGPSPRCLWCRRTRLRRQSRPSKTQWCPSNRSEGSTKLLRQQR